jgi:[ribosomal protein S5]-alanine N-acetyltransferase
MASAAHIIETSRLVLREFVRADAEALTSVLSDAETMRYYPAPLTRTGVEEWIDRNRKRYAIDRHGLWAMVLRSSGELIGDCGLIRQKIEDIEEIEIGYHVRRDLWRQGLASEAALACRDYGLARLSVDRLISLIRPENLPSRRVAEKIGMNLWKQVLWHELPHYVYVIRRAELAAHRSQEIHT